MIRVVTVVVIVMEFKASCIPQLDLLVDTGLR